MMKIATTQVWVQDQDEALAFYTEKLGMEVRADVTMPEMGNFRWLTVSPTGPGGRRDRPDGDPRRARLRRRHRAGDPRPDGQGRRRRHLPHDRRRPRRVRGAQGAVASSSSTRPRSVPTASTAGSATRPATTSGSRSSPTSSDARQVEHDSRRHAQTVRSFLRSQLDHPPGGTTCTSSPPRRSGSTIRTRPSPSTPTSSACDVREDVTLPELGGFRWLTVSPAGQPDVADRADGDPRRAGLRRRDRRPAARR